jgi:hypothetical protein
MTTKPPAKVKEEDPSSPVKMIYNMVEELKDIIPVMNDRYRLGFCLHKYYDNEANSIHEALISANPASCKIDIKELEKLLIEKYNKLDLSPQNK